LQANAVAVKGSWCLVEMPSRTLFRWKLTFFIHGNQENVHAVVVPGLVCDATGIKGVVDGR
jgi:hypothetical protein